MAGVSTYRVGMFVLAVTGTLTVASTLVGNQPTPAPSSGPVPKAQCGPGDRTESGLQGQTTLAERFSGPSRAYNCNLELVGQFEGEGAGFDLADFGNCIYYGTYGVSTKAPQQYPGTAVVDASDPRHPRATAYLDSAAMVYVNEGLDVHKGRKLLSGARANGEQFELYDLSADCRHPVLKGSVELKGVTSHAGSFAPDGRTYYGATLPTGAGGAKRSDVGLYSIDVSDPARPREIIRWIHPKDIGDPHHVSISADGTRAYVALFGNWPNNPGPNGLGIVDVSDIQARRPNPQYRLISTLLWKEGAAAQVPLTLTIKGRPYLIFTDAGGTGGYGPKAAAAACAQGLAPFGYGRIIDISDEKNPKIVSTLKLEVSDPANCSKVLNDPTIFIGYSSLFCTPDDVRNAKLLACAFFEAGLRVFDIRDPFHPKEVAYYKPPARRKESRPGAPFFSSTGESDRTADGVSVPASFRKNGEEIWFLSLDNGFQIVRFTDRFRAAQKGLF